MNVTDFDYKNRSWSALYATQKSILLSFQVNCQSWSDSSNSLSMLSKINTPSKGDGLCGKKWYFVYIYEKNNCDVHEQWNESESVFSNAFYQRQKKNGPWHTHTHKKHRINWPKKAVDNREHTLYIMLFLFKMDWFLFGLAIDVLTFKIDAAF